MVAVDIAFEVVDYIGVNVHNLFAENTLYLAVAVVAAVVADNT